jgi:two-component system phosphate regulon sensor histidine kinase PhoR
MKIDRTYLFIGISTLALVTVLAIQVNWIFETAKIKEVLFNEKASIVLSKTTEALKADKRTFKQMRECMGNPERRKIDSLLEHFMNMYNIHIDYYFEVNPAKSGDPYFLNTPYTNEPGCFNACIKDDNLNVNSSGVNLKLIFPDEDQFIMDEMRIPFLSSIALILVVLFLSWRTILSLLKEKQISENTTEFLNNMTHEFKTPLTNIALAGKMIVKDANISQEEKVRHYSGIILLENDKLTRQVEQVLSMTALERGEIPIHKTELDLHALIHESLKCISVQIEHKHGAAKLTLDAEKHQVVGDHAHLTNAICNLIDNAIKYSKDNPEISIQTYNEDKNIVIEVGDNGIGIDAKYHDKVFDKFFRVPTGDVHDVKGFGLGLAYIKKIIELHGGRIELDSELNNGTSFIITLPYA